MRTPQNQISKYFLTSVWGLRLGGLILAPYVSSNLNDMYKMLHAFSLLDIFITFCKNVDAFLLSGGGNSGKKISCEPLPYEQMFLDKASRFFSWKVPLNFFPGEGPPILFPPAPSLDHYSCYWSYPFMCRVHIGQILFSWSHNEPRSSI